jgi:protein-L-isoaspartate O-methyltransferase
VHAKNALSQVYRGEWHKLYLNLKFYTARIDLDNASLLELKLSEEQSHYYANSGGADLEIVLEALKITHQDSILDFGSGKGGALITFSKYPFTKITGIELSPKLVEIAEKNLANLGIKNISMSVGNATDFTDLGEYNYFYFFSPFPANVMSAVVKNIRASLVQQPRKVMIIYFNPEFHDAIVSGSPFVKTREFHHHELSFYIYSN